MHLCCRIFVTTFLALFFPVIIFVLIFVCLMSVSFGYCDRVCKNRLNHYSIFKYFILPLTIITVFFIQVGLCLILASIIYAIVIGPIVIYLLVMIVRIVFWWAIRNCKINKKLSESQLKLQQDGQEKLKK